jgi:hypothetical protein
MVASEMSAARSTGSEDQRRFRCRMGLHRWVQFKHGDADLENPGADAVWLTRCRYCGVERGSGVSFMMVLVGVAAATGALLWWLVSPVLGVLLLMGAVLGLLAVARAFALSRPSRFGFRYRG